MHPEEHMKSRQQTADSVTADSRQCDSRQQTRERREETVDSG
jgi:hypothetical protein